MTSTAVPSLPVLLYHSVSEASMPGFRRWTVSTARFSSHMEALAAAGYQPLSMTEAALLIAHQKSLPKRPVVITFDDGFRDFLTHALPVLSAHSFRATLYVTSGYLGETSRWLADVGEQSRPMLEPSDLNTIAGAGVEVGAHGHSHAMLDLLPDELMRADIQRSRQILTEQVGEDVVSFAYPHGYSNANVRRATQEAGFTTACAVHDAMSSGLSETFEIPRIIVEHGTDEDTLLSKLQGNALRAERYRHGKAAIWRVRRAGWRSRQRVLVTTLGR